MRKNYATIIRQLAAAKCSGELADKLYCKEVITDGVYEEGTAGDIETTRIRALIKAVHAKVEINKEIYYTFLEIVKDITGLEDILQLLQGKCFPLKCRFTYK